MAAVIKALWGPHPAFLKISSKKTLPALVGHFPDHGTGSKVTLREWFNKGLHEHYYTLSSVIVPSSDPSTWEFKGFKTISGMPLILKSSYLLPDNLTHTDET
jgi:hypothetical protein